MNNHSNQPAGEGVPVGESALETTSSSAVRMQTIDRENPTSPEVMGIHHQVIREMEEPRDGVAATPVWLMILYFGLVMWGGYYLSANSGAFRVDVYNEDPAAIYSRHGDADGEGPVDLMSIGKRSYNNCVQCHQMDGSGVAGTFPPLDGSERVTGPPHVLVAILLHGIRGEVIVKGQSYSGEMPAWNHLNDEEIAGVLSYVRTSWKNEQSQVSTALVREVREMTSGQSGAYTDAALDALAAQSPPDVSLESRPTNKNREN